MTSCQTHTPARWQSFEVVVPPPFEPLLTQYLWPFVRESRDARLLKRFFFIRYSEGGYHLRLRFLPSRRATARWSEDELGLLVSRYATDTQNSLNGCTLESRIYDRTTLYFGETMLSVYAELLNEQSSYLALRLLCAGQPGPVTLLAKLGAILLHVLRRMFDNPGELCEFCGHARKFASESMQRLGLTSPEWNEAVRNKLRTFLDRSARRSDPSIDCDRNVARLCSLLRRLRTYYPSGQMVAVHAVHLLFNKLGFSLMDEYCLFGVLSGVAAKAAS
jgi:thiopeptide-type bacteriocin biosynthesis protein